jgi:co-chaperonin GroES (HSP10)
MSDFAIKETREEAEIRAKQLPVPVGYKILAMVPKIEDKFKSGLAKADETMRVEQQISVVLYVCKLGPDCYKDLNKFPTGPYCKEGDFILTRSYTGTRLLIHGAEFRLLNDDSVDAVVEDPRGIGRP